MAELFSILAQGSSHWFSINGDTSCEISLCRLLGFLSPMDYYAFLVSKGLAAYEFNSKKREMEIEIKFGKWEQYLCNKRYGLCSPENTEVTIARFNMENLLGDKTKQNNKRYDHYIIRLGKKDSETYASKISLQEIFLPTIPGWRSKQRYFKRNINEHVMNTLLDNDDVFNDAIKELDQQINPTSDEDEPEPMLVQPPTAKKQKTIDEAELFDELKLPSNEPRESYLSGFVSTVLKTVLTPFRGLFPFTNIALNRERDFDLNITDDKGLVDNHITDFIGMKQNLSGNKSLLQYRDTRNGRDQSFVKVSTSTSDKSFLLSRVWLDQAIEVNSCRDGDMSSSIRRITKHLIRKDRNAVEEAMREMGMDLVERMGTVTEAAMYKAAGVKSRTARRTIRRHLRHHFGPKVFASENSLMELNAENIKRIDLTTGGDHGQGALQQGVQVTTVVKDEIDLEGHDEDDKHSFT